jgi:hypothetical protein
VSAISATSRRSPGLLERLALGTWGLLGAIAGVLALAQSLRSPVVSTDTVQVVQTAAGALTHLRNGQLLNWGGSYPLLQALPASALLAAGLSSQNVIMGLVALNVLSLAVMLWVAWSGLAGLTRAGAILLVAVLLSGPFVWYAHSSFGEPLAAAVTLAAVVAAWKDRRQPALVSSFVLAAISKDTSVPFLFLLTLAASTGSPNWADVRFRRRRLAALVVAVAAGLLVTAAYNYARYGSVLYLPNLAPRLFVPSLQTQASFFASVWLSPNGGVLLFWPSFAVLLLLATLATARTARASRDWRQGLRSLAPAAGVVGTLLGMTLVLSKWVAPMGWTAWGPRLMLPWLPACAYLLITAYSRELEGLLARLGRLGPVYLLLAILLAAASVPQYVAMVHPTLWLQFLTPDALCPVAPIIENGAGQYYRCINHMLWTKGSMLAAAYLPGAAPMALLLGCACAAGLVWLLQRVRAAAVAP